MSLLLNNGSNNVKEGKRGYKRRFYVIEKIIIADVLAIFWRYFWIWINNFFWINFYQYRSVNGLKPRIYYYQECFPIGEDVGKIDIAFTTQLAITCSKLTIGILEQGVKYVQS